MGKKDRQAGPIVHRYEVPFGVNGLPLANAELGIGKLQTRPDPYSYAANVTILDAPDHRLVRAGVLLAHRIIGGVGEWYLSAPAWQPYLPAEELEERGTEDLPERFANLILPFRRRATLAAVATITYKRVEYIVTGTDDRQLALLRDERATVRRGGLTTSRFRQATVTVLEAEPEQLAAIDEALQVVGGARVREFASIAQRLGTPATGLSDFPAPRELDPDSSLESFVGALMGWHLHAVMLADVAVRAGQGSEAGPVCDALQELAGDIRGLEGCLDKAWAEDVLADIEWICARPPETPIALRLGERYLGVIDRLIRAARAPRVGALALRPAGNALEQQAQLACTAMIDAADAIHPYSDDADWAALGQRIAHAQATIGVAEHLLGKKAKRERKRLRSLAEKVGDACGAPEPPSDAELRELNPIEAFGAGRDFERQLAGRQTARTEFCAAWPQRRRKLRSAQARG